MNGLTEGLTPISLAFEPYGERPVQLAIMLTGIWGGTTDEDRFSALARLSRDDAVEALERSFPKRLRRALRAARPALARPGVGHLGRRERLRQLVAEQQVMAPVAHTRRQCESCGAVLPALSRSDRRYCSVRCQVAGWRARAA